jgi:uncharacterized protein (DUF1330 family)
VNGKRTFLYIGTLLLCVVVSAIMTKYLVESTDTSGQVYLVGAVTITDPDRLSEYRAIAEPLAHRAGGYVPIAFGEPGMIEGDVPASGLLFIERYDSMEGLNAFIQSEEFQQAKKLRDQVADVHFMLTLEAYKD